MQSQNSLNQYINQVGHFDVRHYLGFGNKLKGVNRTLKCLENCVVDDRENVILYDNIAS